MASPSASTALADLTDPGLFPDRNTLIHYLMTVCGWSSAHVGSMFEITDRQARRIVEKRPPWRPGERVEDPALTRREAEMLLRDVSVDPYATAEERELIEQWVTSHAQASGIAELARPSVRTTPKFLTKPRPPHRMRRVE